VFILFAWVASLTIASGGELVGVLYASCLVPLAAVLLLGRRGGIIWTLLIVSVLIGVSVRAELGGEFAIRPDPEVVAVSKFRGAIALTVAALVASLIYETFKNRALREIVKAYRTAQKRQQMLTESERALRESEKRYRTLFMNALVCIHEIDLDGCIQTMNPAGLRILGASSEDEVRGTPYLDLVSAFDRARVAALLEQACHGRVCEFEFASILEDGPRLFASSFIPIRGEDGAVAKLIAHTHDVTERRRAEDELKASEEKYQDLYENAPDMYASADVSTGRIGECNLTAIRALGFSKDEIIGRGLLDLYHPDCREDVVRVLETFRKCGEAEAEGLQLLKRDGGTIDVSLKITSVRDEDGNVLHSRSSWRDISDRKRAEGALRASEERLEMVLDATSEGLWDWNIVTGEMFFSPRWFASLEYESGDFPSHISSWESLVHPGDIDRVWELFADHIAGRTEICEAEIRLLKKSGEWKQCLARGRVVERDAEGRPLRMVGVDIDVTERRRTEAALQQARKLESLGILAGGVAHDFNNLLVGILGNAELALTELPDDSSAREKLKDIQTSSHYAADLTNQLLVYAGRGELRIRVSDLGTLVGETVRLVRSSLSRDVEIEFETDGSPTLINADAGQIRQLIVNLLLNATESLDSKRGTVQVATGVMWTSREYLAECFAHAELPEGDYAFVEIRDDGCGMDRDEVSRIFDPFFSTKSKGRGLGLASALGIVRGHGGTIHVESEPGRGTTFRVTLPLTTSPEPEVEEKTECNQVAAGGMILVVDDDPTVLSVATRMLSHAGFEVVEVSNGEDAVTALGDNGDRISAVLLDVTMPHMSGETTFDELRKLRPSLPVLFFSGHSEEDGASLTRIRTRTSFLRKPFTLAELTEKLNDLLSEEADGSSDE
jgi:PAS domain S-box-containing protein